MNINKLLLNTIIHVLQYAPPLVAKWSKIVLCIISGKLLGVMLGDWSFGTPLELLYINSTREMHKNMKNMKCIKYMKSS